jgi:hypothetical protein
MGKRACVVIGIACLAALMPTGATASTLLFTNANGDQVLTHRVLLQQTRPLYAGTRTPGNDFGTLLPVTDSGGFFSADAVVDDAGGATALFSDADPSPLQSRDTTVTVATRQPGGGFASQFSFESWGRDRPVLAGNGRGDAAVAWKNALQDDYYAFRPSGGRFGAPAPPPGDDCSALGVALDPDGSLVYFCQRYDRTSHELRITEFVRRPGEDGFTETSDVPALQGPPPRFVVASGGRALALETGNSTGSSTINVIDRAPGGHFGQPTATPVPDYVAVDDVALASSGAAAIVFGPEDTYLTVRDPGGSFQKPMRIAARIPVRFPGDIRESIRVRIDDRGDTVVAWQGERGSVRSVYRPAGSAAGPARTLVAVQPFAPAPLDPPGLAIDGNGRATVAWEESDAVTVRTLTRDFDAVSADPPVQVDSVPSFVREGPPETCRPADAQLLRSSDEVTVYNHYHYGPEACLLARGTPVPLVEQTNSGQAYESIQPPTSMALRGPLVAYGVTYSSVRSGGATSMRVIDLRDPYSGLNRSTSLVDSAHPATLVTTRLKQDGAVAWIHRRRGRTKQVLVWDAHAGKPRRVDSGRRIDPRTFKLHGSRLTWRKRGKLHHATLR